MQRYANGLKKIFYSDRKNDYVIVSDSESGQEESQPGAIDVEICGARAEKKNIDSARTLKRKQVLAEIQYLEAVKTKQVRLAAPQSSTRSRPYLEDNHMALQDPVL